MVPFATRRGSAFETDARPEQPHGIIDCNVHLFQWPCRRLPLDQPEKLAGHARSLGIKRLWAGSYEGLLHRDIAAVNERLFAACALHSELVPLGEVNLNLPGWERDLNWCLDQQDCLGVRLHPGYHGYGLDEKSLARLLHVAGEAKRQVQICVAMEDPRTQHPLLRVDDVELGPLPELARQNSKTQIQLLNWRPRGAVVAQLAAEHNVLFDTARVDSTDGLQVLAEKAGAERILFGSHAPFLIPEAALIRFAESQLTQADLVSVLRENALRVQQRPEE